MKKKGFRAAFLTEQLEKKGFRFEDHQIERMSNMIAGELPKSIDTAEERRAYVARHLDELIKAWRAHTGAVFVQITYAIDSNLVGGDRLAFVEKLLRYEGVARNHSLNDAGSTEINKGKQQHIERIVLKFAEEPTMDEVNQEVLKTLSQQRESGQQ